MKTIKAKVHMLPTKEITNVLVNTYIDPEKHSQSPVLDIQGRNKVYLESKGEVKTIESRGFKFHHLYITTDEEIKEGDWVLIDWRTIDAIDIEQCESQERADMLNKRETTRKIIATTDPKLIISISKSMNKDKFPDITLPQIPQSFIEEYCKAGGIDEVLVECDEIEVYMNTGIVREPVIKDWIDKPKLNPDNTIIIHPVEEKMYSREEVESYLKDFQSALHEEHDIPTQNMGFRLRWIKENL